MNENIFLLSFLFVIKLLLFIIIPIFLIITRKYDYKISKYISYIDIIGISIFIILLLINSSFISSINIKGIKNAIKIKNGGYYFESYNVDEVDEIITNEIYKTNNLKDVYYFNNNSLPLSDKKLYCDGKVMYLKNFGNSITSLATMVSTALNRNIDPIEILNLAYYNEIIDCENGVDIDDLINIVSNEYNVSIKNISANEINSYLNKDVIVMEEINYKEGNSINLTCNKSYIILYKNESNKIRILDPNDYTENYICPDNTSGSLSVIKGKNNSKEFNYYDLVSIGSRYIILEGK